MTTIREWIEKNKDKYKDRKILINECRTQLKVSKRAVQKIASVLVPWEGPSQQKERKEKPNGRFTTLTEQDLRRKHDGVFRVTEAAKAIPEGQFITEADFISSLNLRGGYRAILERKDFELYRGRADGGVYYWAHPKSMQKMKNERVLT